MAFSITRGTTPKIEIELPFTSDALAYFVITFSQNDRPVFHKEMEDCTWDENTVITHLSQEETLKLKDENETEIQLRGRTNEGEAVATQIWRVYTERILKDGVI